MTYFDETLEDIYIICTAVSFMFWTYLNKMPAMGTGWTFRGRNPGGDETYCTLPDRLWGPSSLLYHGYRVFPGGKEAGAWP
jgi:hypothetical protein